MSKAPPLDSVFTPFIRRFTDERARDLEGLRALYHEVRKMHFASPYAAEDAPIQVSKGVYADFVDRVRLTEEAYKRLRELNRNRVNIFQPACRDSSTLNPNEDPASPAPHSQPPGDPSAASEDW